MEASQPYLSLSLGLTRLLVWTAEQCSGRAALLVTWVDSISFISKRARRGGLKVVGVATASETAVDNSWPGCTLKMLVVALLGQASCQTFPAYSRRFEGSDSCVSSDGGPSAPPTRGR